MKIVCDACQAKYSISDDKVQGKVFKIRCKKCSNIIVVRGGAGASEPAAAAPAVEKEHRVYDYGYEGGGDQPPAGDDAVWHVVINQDQVGPMTAADVEQRYAAGELDSDTYIWREGFADWLPLAQVDTFAGLASAGSTVSAGDSGGGANAVAAMFGGGDEGGTMRSDPSDLFAAASSAHQGGDDDGGDLFGSAPAPRSTAAHEAAAAKLRGERNENSVLFSLNNLAQLASDKPIQASAPSSSGGGGGGGGGGAGHATGQAGGEGSGLIDIRSMANAYLGNAGAAAKPATSSAIGSIDDLPVFGGGGFSEPAVIVPTSARPSSGGNSKLLYVLIGSVGLLAVAAVVLVVVMMKGDDKPAQVAASDTTEAGATAGGTTGGTKEPTTGPTEPKAADPSAGATPPSEPAAGATPPGEPSAATPPTPTPTPAASEPKATDKPDKKPGKTPARKEPKEPRETREPRAPAVAAKEPKAPVAEKPAASGGCDEVSCVLNNYEGACCAKFRKGGKPAGGGGGIQIGEKPRSDVPESLDRAMISDGVGKVKARVQSCGDKSSAKGQVKVSVKVNPDGSVANVSVKNTPDPGLGNCVASAMQRASFRKTSSGGSFSYPFMF